jgi:hypothetical protein
VWLTSTPTGVDMGIQGRAPQPRRTPAQTQCGKPIDSAARRRHRTEKFQDNWYQV